MDMLNKWTVGLVLLAIGIPLAAIGGYGEVSETQIGIGVFLAIIGAGVLIRAK